MISIILTTLLFILAVSLIGLVIMQPDRSQGMSSSFGGGGASSSVFGVSEDGGPLAKITQWVAIGFIVVSLLLYILQ